MEITLSDRWGSRPALTSDDLPHPDGPQINPAENVLSASVSSMRVFQKRILSGSPSRSRGPGRSSRKKSASWASKERNPFGTILIGWWSEVGVVGPVPDRLAAIDVDGGCTTGVIAGELILLALCWLTVC